MPNDLWYFYESDLSKGCLVSFHDSLPDHLRKMFVDSIGGFNIFDRDVTNCLQGYRGPHTHTNGSSSDSEYLGACNGLQEIRYWWGVSKHLLWATVLGAVVFAVWRSAQDSGWHSLYFDSKTGECLSHDKNKVAEKLNIKGHQLFQEGKYAEAKEYHNNAYLACSSGYKNEQEFKKDRDRAAEEAASVNLNSQGERLFSEGQYNKALGKYQEAYDKSQISRECNEYRTNKEKAQGEIDALNLNSEGDSLYRESKYNEALEKYQETYDKSECSKECNEYRTNIEKVQAEIDAINLNSEGDSFYSQGKYTEALGKYQKAYDKSQIFKEYNKYRTNKLKAQAEIDAINLNSEGDSLYRQRKYTEALGKYQEAYDKSKVEKECDKYSSHKMRAHAEIDAINLSLEGDNLFHVGKYDEALRKYQAAYEKSLVEKEKNKCALSKNNVQAIKDRLTTLDTLWKEAWEVESDTANDRLVEAEELFQRVLSETKDTLKIYPDNLRFKRYEILVSLKTEGNQLFNEGLEAQQDGSKLLQEAQINLQQQFESALMKYKEAKSKFSQAQEKFKTGRETDRRFVSCIDFVQGQLDQVLQSVEAIEQHTLSSRLLNLDISISESCDCFEAVSSRCNITGDHNYCEQI